MHFKNFFKSIITGVCAMFMAISLAACGSSNSFAGTWQLSDTITEGQHMSEEDLKLLDEMGLHIYLDINDDNTAVLDLYGETYDATVTTEDGKTVLSSEALGGTNEMRLDNGKLVIYQTVPDPESDVLENSMVFTRIKPEDKVSSDAMDDVVATTEDGTVVTEDETLDAEGETNVIGDVEDAVEDAAEGVAETSDGAVEDVDKEALADKTSEAVTTNTQN